MNSTNNQIVNHKILNQINIIIGKYIKEYTNKISKKYKIEKTALFDIWNKVISDVKTDESDDDNEKTYDETKKSDETEKPKKIKKPDETEKPKKPKKPDESENIWKKQEQLGQSGKEGTCYKVINNLTNKEFAMKEFKPKKSHKKFDLEVSYQRKAGELGIGPKVIDVIYDPPRIVMEMMNRTIEQVIKDQNGILTEDQQNDIISLCKKMDKNNIYHCDPNPLNLMEGFDGKFRWIDYGMSKDINIKKHTNNPNLKALKYCFYSGMQGLVTKKVICEDNICLINKQINL